MNEMLLKVIEAMHENALELSKNKGFSFERQFGYREQAFGMYQVISMMKNPELLKEIAEIYGVKEEN